MSGPADEGFRPLLFSVAYGMTGSVADAEDIVQDAYLGLTRARQAGTTVNDPKAYLTTAVTRRGINYLSSARVRRETYVGDWLPEPVVVPQLLGASLRPAWVNGQPGAVTYDAGGRVVNVFALEIADGRVQTIRSVVNPDKLGHLGPVSDVARLAEKPQAKE